MKLSSATSSHKTVMARQSLDERIHALSIEPAFGQIGLGTQYRSTLTLDELLQQGFLEEVGP